LRLKNSINKEKFSAFAIFQQKIKNFSQKLSLRKNIAQNHHYFA
jgi:hypothetical protein